MVKGCVQILEKSIPYFYETYKSQPYDTFIKDLKNPWEYIFKSTVFSKSKKLSEEEFRKKVVNTINEELDGFFDF